MSVLNQQDMQFYYGHVYPYKPIYQWLNRSFSDNGTRNMINREIAIEFKTGAYGRYFSFPTLKLFKEKMINDIPNRFEIGAIYSSPPKKKDSVLKNSMKPLEKELVFDIDMDDYDGYRTCCSGAQICGKCWKFIEIAIKVMNITLVEDFGFEEFFWVFSGRRGAHCWVSDTRSCLMNDLQRRNVLDYLNVVKDRDIEKKIGMIHRPLHPFIERSLTILKQDFVDIILREQDPWRDDEQAIKTLLAGFYDKNLISHCKKYWLENPGRSSEVKWCDIDFIAARALTYGKKPEYIEKLKHCKEDLILKTLYPKFDIEVTKQMIHLLKAPFCIHPKTLNVCVPIMTHNKGQDLQGFSIQDFDPTECPKLNDLINAMSENGMDISTTNLRPYVELFNKFTQTYVKGQVSVKREHENSLDF